MLWDNLGGAPTLKQLMVDQFYEIFRLFVRTCNILSIVFSTLPSFKSKIKINQTNLLILLLNNMAQ